MSLPPKTQLGRYEIRALLGAGGMGEVYLAHDTSLNRKVALKVLPVEVASNQDRMRRFKQEATAAASLNHPNIAHIYEIGEASGHNFIAMEYVQGATLRAMIHEEKEETPETTARAATRRRRTLQRHTPMELFIAISSPTTS